MRRLRDVLAELGWRDNFLSWDGRYARLGMRKGQPVFEPFSKMSRLRNWGAHLPVKQLIKPNLQIRFDDVLRGDRCFFGLVRPHAGENFPFDRTLIIKNINVGLFDEFLVGEEGDGQDWYASYIVLTFLHEVSIST